MGSILHKISLLGCGSFITIALGGLSIGIIIGLLTSLLTRCTKDVRIIEPLALFCGGYLAYIMAELVHWSGIISLIGCGLVQVWENILAITHLDKRGNPQPHFVANFVIELVGKQFFLLEVNDQ